MTPIFLIGYMGCGKTTLGRAVGRMAGVNFIDLDGYIENRFHTTVTALFAERGEEGFRRLERAMLEEVSGFEDTVIACGGGTPCFFDNMELMNSCGTTVWLDTELERICERLLRNRSRRPLLAGKSDDELREFVVGAMAAREPYYSQATARFNGHFLEDRNQIKATASDFIKRFIDKND